MMDNVPSVVTHSTTPQSCATEHSVVPAIRILLLIWLLIWSVMFLMTLQSSAVDAGESGVQ